MNSYETTQQKGPDEHRTTDRSTTNQTDSESTTDTDHTESTTDPHTTDATPHPPADVRRGTPSHAYYDDTVAALDTLARRLLATVERDRSLDPQTRRTAVRHARELRAELERTRLTLGLVDHPIPPVVRDSGAGTVTLGPDPGLFERHGDR